MEAMQQAWEVTTKGTNTMNDDNQTTPAKPWWGYKGMSAIEHAALVTGQPCSGTPWLDEMLAKARRERLAGQALAGIDFSQMLAAAFGENMTPNEAGRHVALGCVKMADAIISALEGGAK
jgi:hypothetical protein